MSIKFSSYMNIKEEHMQLFEQLWSSIVPGLPSIQSNVQNAENVRAAAFNVWLNYANLTDYLILKADRQILHSFDVRLIERLNTFLSNNELLKDMYYKNKHNEIFIFKFSYFLTYEIFYVLEQFTTEHDILMNLDLKQYPYYFWSDKDIEQHNEIYLLMKYLNADFLNNYLCEHVIHMMSIRIYRNLIQFNKSTQL